MAFDPPSSTAVFVTVAFIALDTENLCETNNDRFTTDFGDNKFPYFKGRASHFHQQALEENDNNDDNDDNDDDADGADQQTTSESA